MAIGTWLALGEVVWVIGLGIWIILERRSPAATLAWVFALAWIPLLGIPVYLLIGPRRLRRKKLRYRRSKSRFAEASHKLRDHPEATLPDSATAVQQRPLVLLAERAGQLPPLRASRVELYSCGDDCYQAIEQAMAEARHHIHLEYYIWEADSVGTRFRDLLCDKAGTGIQIRLLVDAIGSARLGRRFLRPLREAGAEIAWFNPMGLARFRPDLVNFRTHRKIIVCDGCVGFTGGINICDDHSAAVMRDLAWRDTHVRIEGPPVGDLQLAFLEDWHFATGSVSCTLDYFRESHATASGPWVQVLASGPDHDSYAIERFFFAAIAEAKRRVLISTPYFVPNESLLSALATAAMRGVDVQILVPKRSDSWLVTAAARSYYEELARVGVRLHEYGPPMLHAKTLVVDDDISLVGTANMDNRSFRLNFEIAAVFYDRGLADSLAEMFHADLWQAAPYCLREARRAPFWKRLSEATARLLSPVL
jgi:cardiolipin synthase A/B